MSSITEMVEAFLVASEMPQSAFGKAAVGDPNLVRRLRNGLDVRTRTAARIAAFIDDYWSKNPHKKLHLDRTHEKS